MAAGCAGAGEWPVPVAHRGGAHEFDENTLAAFQGSYAKGLGRFETDIRMTRDGALVLMHDDTVARTTDGAGAVEAMTAGEVRELRTKKTNAPVPFLDDLLDFFADKKGVVLQLELKTNKKLYPDAVMDTYCRKVHQAVTAKLAPAAFCYSSFDRRALAAMRGVSPDAQLIALVGPCSEQQVKEARELGVGTLSCKLKGSTREAVEQVKRAGLTVGGFGAATLADYQFAAELGLAFVTTDRPVEVRAWLDAQGGAACPGDYPRHLQGIAVDDGGNIYWSFTTVLVKTDAQGRQVGRVEVPSHYGDLTWHDGKVYVAVNLGKFNQEPGAAQSWVYVHDAASLALLAKHAVPEVVHGAGGMEWHDGRFFVVGGLTATRTENDVYEYTEAFAFVRRHVIASGQTLMGIQTVCRGRDGAWWFGCYGKPAVTLCTDDAFALRGIYVFDSSVGIARTESDGVLLIGKNRVTNKSNAGSVSRVNVEQIKTRKQAR